MAIDKKFYSDVDEYFRLRGWDGAYLFAGNFLAKEIYIDTNFFTKNNVKLRWYSCKNLTKFFEYFIHFLEHIKPFWIKYNMGEQEFIILSKANDGIKIYVNAECIMYNYAIPV